MTGEEMKALRLGAGFSQAQLGALMGLSRESIGRMERSTDVIEKRTELALRYIALRGQTAEIRLIGLRAQIAAVLDDASVRATPSIERSQMLKQALADWVESGGDENGRRLIERAQGLMGLINVSDPADGSWPDVMTDLIRLKREWAALAP